MAAIQKQDRVLVTGATGNVGGAVAAGLLEQGASVRALVRDESKAAGLAESGVEIVVGDMDQPETLDAALDGVDRVFLVTAVNPSAVAQVRNVLDAAKRTGGPHIVRLSAVSPSANGPLIGQQHAESEADIKASGLPFTLLRPHSFMQNVMMAAASVASEGAIYLPLKDGRLGLIDLRDVAECAVAILTEDGHSGNTYTITGPDSISHYDVAAELSAALGKKVNYVDIPLEACREALGGMGFDDWTADAFVDIFKAFSENRFDSTTGGVEELTGHAPRSFARFASDFAAVFGGEPAVA